MVKLSTIQRRRGVVARLLVELDVHQVQELEEAIQQLGMTKADAIAAALNIWLGMVRPKQEVSSHGVD